MINDWKNEANISDVFPKREIMFWLLFKIEYVINMNKHNCTSENFNK